MWFRITGSGGSSDADPTTPTSSAGSPSTPPTASSNSSGETSKFEKFRRASFRRKSTGQAPTRKRSKSPHFILQAGKSTSLEEANEEDDDEMHDKKTKESKLNIETIGDHLKRTDNSPFASSSGEVYKSELDIVLIARASELPVPLSDPKSKAPVKKTTLKTIKTDPPKRKFYKNFSTTTAKRQNSYETAGTSSLQKIVDRAEHNDDDDTESDTTDDDDDDDGETEHSLPQRGKEKMLLTDPKYKHNRIEKSSSKTKMSELDKRESIKRSRSARKISAPPILNEDSNNNNNNNKKKDKKEKHTRAHTNLNLHALVKFVVNNKKFLNTDDFAIMRRKSISEAASTVMAVAAGCKPLPIALKYPQDGVVAEAPKENDTKAERNVVLVKKQNLKNSFCDGANKNIMDTVNEKKKERSGIAKEKANKGSKEILKNGGSTKALSKVQRNSSNSSKSSGNFEDEAFYSCDEQEKEERLKGEAAAAAANALSQSSPDDGVMKRKSSSPSLTSRVAAKINETTNNYKNRKAAAAASKSAKKRKTLASVGKRPEYYKQISVERLHSTSIVRQPSDRRPDANVTLRNGNASSANSGDLQSSFHASAVEEAVFLAVAGAAGGGGTASGGVAAASAASANRSEANAQDAVEGKDARRERLHQQHQQNKSAPVSVNRSESYKERLSHKRNRNSRRKTSDPSLTSRPNDDQPDLGLSNSNYTASSNSSLSSGGGSESPSTSMEQVGGAGATAAGGHHHQQHAAGHHGPHHTHQHSHQDSFHGSIGGGSTNASNISFWSGASQLTRQFNFESDEEDDLNEADWSSNVAADMLAALTDAEKKRQEIINEIFQTERSHVRTLKLLERLFFCPLQDSGLLTHDHLLLLFPPALISLRELHGAFEQKLKQRRLEHNHIVSHVGDLLASMFDGQSGDELREFAAHFCARQQIALEALKEKRRKDEQLQKLLSKAESHKACRRLQLKDLLPTVLQRLTKYPLLFENLYKVTIRVVPENTTEAEAIQRALESSKKILVDVNQAVKTAEDAHKLQNIQRKLDKSTFDKDEFKNLDLPQYRLIHDGSLTMKKNPNIQLHGLLFENMIVLLTKQDDKYSLKYLHAARNTEVNNKPVSPIMNIDSETLVRQEAADKNSFFLIKTKTSQMLELRAPSSSECKTWFKHISDAAEQYKPRSKNANHEPVDDPAIATLPHSNTKESLELTPERPPPLAATATMTTTPLAPMLPLATATSATAYHNNNNDANVQLRRQSSGGRCDGANTPLDSGAYHKQRLSHNELTPASVNRTMSTRSCGETNNNYGTDLASGLNGVTLRHTQSARQANAAGGSIDEQGLGGGASGSSAGGTTGAGSADGSKRNSSSIVYSNNSNNTRTLMQSSPPLVEPTAIQISISPAHTAEPVLTPAERLRRLDASIRDGLLEKQKIICDMFRLPVEHFHEIVDIAAMPEAPKDSADIALAAYAQVQSLTEVLNDYMHVTAEQEISAVSTAVCDQCHDKQRQRPVTPSLVSTTLTAATSIVTTTQVAIATTSHADSPPPLPPPNKQQAQAQQQTPSPAVTKLHTTTLVLDEANIHEDDDGYCEIDELRLPALPPLVNLTATKAKASSPPPPLPPPAGTFKTPPPPPPPPSAAATSTAATTPELVKRQSTISADSIPEESADEVTQAMDDNPKATITATVATVPQQTESSNVETVVVVDTTQKNAPNDDKSKESEEKTTEKSNDVATDKTDDAVEETTNESTECSEAKTAEPASTSTDEPSTSLNSEHIEINDAYDTLTTLNKLNAALTMVDGMTQTLPMTTATLTSFITNATNNAGTNANGSLLQPLLPHCGPNRIQHANSLEPSVPCHALNSIVSALNAQISLLLPKINERDMERERLRKENQHLRELLNAMHERQRVAEKLETPTDITTSADADDEIDGSSTSITPTPTTPTPANNANSTTPSTATATETATVVETEN